MRTWKKRLSLLLVLVMLVSALPTTVLADETDSGESDEVIYNLSKRNVVVSTDEEASEVFDENGNYTIQLEDDAFFPYEVQFTYGGETWSEWFMTPESTVTVGGHTFYVASEQTGADELIQLGVTINGVYVPAYPEEKVFTTPVPGRMRLMSMMPLTEKNLSLDLKGFLPDELKAVDVNSVLSGMTDGWYGGSNAPITPNAGDKVIYTKARYASKSSFDDNYTIVSASDGTMDMSALYSYDDDVYLEMIVGAVDQLNTSNTRYIVKVALTRPRDTFTISAAWADQSAVDYTYRSYQPDNQFSYYDGSQYISVRGYYSMGVYASKWKEDHDDSLFLSIDKAAAMSGLDAKVYEGRFETVEAIASANPVEITSKAWEKSDTLTTANASDLYSTTLGLSYSSTAPLTIVWYRGANAVSVMPLSFYLSKSNNDVNFGNLTKMGETTSVADRDYSNYERITVDGSTFYLYSSVMKNSSDDANGTYYIKATYTREGTDATSDYSTYDVKVIAGKKPYWSLTSAQSDVSAGNATDVTSAIFGSRGYGADFSGGIVLTAFEGNNEISYEAIKTVPYSASASQPSEPKPDSTDTYFYVLNLQSKCNK